MPEGTFKERHAKVKGRISGGGQNSLSAVGVVAGAIGAVLKTKLVTDATESAVDDNDRQ